jgi:predicted RNA binding protein YcfA (HicA-like mRNA interferase family)
MGKHPVLKPREVATILERIGFAEARQRGSHRQYRHPDGRCTTYHFTAPETSRPFSFVRLPETLE